MLMHTGRPRATATDLSRVNRVHQIRFQRRLSVLLSCDCSTLCVVSTVVSRQELRYADSDEPSVHARTLGDNDGHSAPVEYVLRDVCSDIRPSVRR